MVSLWQSVRQIRVGKELVIKKMCVATPHIDTAGQQTRINGQYRSMRGSSEHYCAPQAICGTILLSESPNVPFQFANVSGDSAVRHENHGLEFNNFIRHSCSAELLWSDDT